MGKKGKGSRRRIYETANVDENKERKEEVENK